MRKYREGRRKPPEREKSFAITKNTSCTVKFPFSVKEKGLHRGISGNKKYRSVNVEHFPRAICVTFEEMDAIRSLSMFFDDMLVIYEDLEAYLCVWSGNIFSWDKKKLYPFFIVPDHILKRRLARPLDYIYDCALEEQSGIEDPRDFNKSKWNSRIKRNKIQHENRGKVLHQIKGVNYGSKNKNKKKNILHKMKYNPLYEQSGIESLTADEYIKVFEKMLLCYISYYSDSKIITCLAALGVFVPNGIIKTVYDEIVLIFSGSKLENFTLSYFLDSLKNLLLQWETFVVNDFAQSFIAILGKIWVTILSPGLLSKMAPTAVSNMVAKLIIYCKQMDFISAIVKGGIYICNAVDIFIKTGSFSGFISTETIEEKMAKNYRELLVDFNLYKTGDLDFIAKKSQYDFFKRTADLKRDLDITMKSQVGRFLTESKIMMKDVMRMENECSTLEAHKAAREMPYVSLILSGSGINKTHLMKLVAITILRANNYPHEQDYFYYLNDRDKYVSLWKNYTTCIMAEDTANANFDAAGDSEMDMANFIIKAAGNMPHNLVSAELDAKGKQFNRAPVMVMSSNSASQKIHRKSDFPSTVWRRFGCIIEARVRDGYKKNPNSPSIDYSKIPEDQRKDIAVDAWLFNVYKTEIRQTEWSRALKKSFGAVQEEDMDDQYQHEIVRKENRLLTDITLKELLIFLQKDSREHFAKQQDVLEISRDVHDEKYWCSKCKLPGRACNCLEQQSKTVDYSNTTLRNYVMNLRNMEYTGEKIEITSVVSEFKNFLQTYKVTLLSWFDAIFVDCFIRVAERMADKLMYYLKNPTKLVPLSLRQTPISVKVFSLMPSVRVCTYIDFFLNWLIFNRFDKWYWYPLFFWLPWVHFSSLTVYHKWLDYKKSWSDWWYGVFDENNESEFDAILNRNALAADIYYYNAEEELSTTISRSAVLAYITSVVLPQLGRYFNNLYLSPEAGLDMSEEEVAVMDNTREKSFWDYKCEKMMDPCPISDRIKHSELGSLLNKNVIYVSSSSSECCNGIMLASHLILIPGHFYRKNVGCLITCTRKPLVSVTIAGNAKFSFYLGNDICKELASDACIVYTPTTGDVTNIIKYFPSGLVRDDTIGNILYRDRNGILNNIPCKNIKGAKNLLERQGPGCTDMYKPNFPGYSYEASTFSGLCGAPITDASRKQSHIMGIHVAGSKTVNYGVCALITQKEIEDIVSQFGYKLVAQSDFNLIAYGKDLQHGKPHPKSPLVTCADSLAGVRLMCGTAQRVSPVSNVVATPIADLVAERFQHGKKWGPAPVRGPLGNDRKHAIKRYVNVYKERTAGLRSEVLEWAKRDYLSAIVPSIQQNIVRWDKEIYVLSDVENVQGIDNKKFINGLNMSTSMGKHLPGVKSSYARQIDGKWVFDDFVLDEFHKRDNIARKRERTFELFSANVKSEPTLSERYEAGKSRIFFAASTHTQLLVRKYLLTTLRYFCTQSETTECCVGINPHSKQWSKIMDYFNEFKGKKFMALDMANFDILTPTALIEAALDIIITVPMLTHNFNEGDINALHVIKHEILHAVVDFNGDVAIVDGIIPSGINLTSILGSVANSLYYRCAFRLIRGPTKFSFKSAVKLLTFGDDSIAKVHNRAGDINMQSIIKALGECGIKCTTGKKDGDTSLYYKLEDLVFLKRAFRYDRDFGCYVGMLDKISIFKSLSCLNPPKTVSKENITGSNIDGALFEMKFAGRDEYEKFRKIITEIATEAKVDIFTRCLDITFDEALLAWRKQYDSTLVTKSRDKSVIDRLRLCMDQMTHLQTWFYRRTPTYTENDNDLDHSVENMVANLALPELEIQSGIHSEQQPVVGFTQQLAPEIVDIGVRDVRNRVSDSNIDMGEFLARPIMIHSVSWSPSIPLNELIHPWKLFLTNKRVANRINNYKLYKSDLHIKVVVTGNPFMYGSGVAAYLPLKGYDAMSGISASGDDYLVQTSQLPKVMIDAANSTGGELILPFIWHEDYLDLVEPRDGLTAAEVMGAMVIKQMTNLRHANEVTTTNTVNITVYAWAENVSVAGPTARNMMGLVAQSGRENETPYKPISQMATNIADAAHVMTKIPPIAPYASAVENAARTASAVASAFGLSKPTDVTSPQKVLVKFASNTATTNDTDSPDKLSTDIKQDITIDPRTVGLKPIDEMSIQYIAGRESFFTKFTWNGSAAADSLLWNIRLSPMIGRSTSVAGPPPYVDYFLTAIAGASLPFEYWTGTIELRFKIVCSKFHKGKLAFVYDPSGTAAVRESNVAFTEIADIADTNDFCVGISNHQSRCWLNVPLIPSTAEYGTSIITDGSTTSYHNGTLAIYVANKLTGPLPATNTNVEVLCFIKAGKDFKLAVPRDSYDNFTPIAPQSGTEETGSQICVDFSSDMLPHDNNVYIGEEIGSFRNLIKRYNFVSGDYINTTDTLVVHRYPFIPEYRGSTPTIGQFNKTCLLNYLRPAFQGFRGGLRYKILYNSPTAEIVISRCFTSVQVTTATTIPTTSYKLTMANSGYFADSFSRGAAIYEVKNYPVAEFELPFYLNYKFVPGKPNTLLISDTIGGFEELTIRSATGAVYSNLFVAAAEDFSFIFFTGWPPMKIASTLT